jgi:hypothetical protein
LIACVPRESLKTNLTMYSPSPLILFFLVLLAPSLRASDFVYRENFETMATGRVIPGRDQHIAPWEGPSRQYGWVGITDQYTESSVGKDHLNVIALHDSSALVNKSPSLQFRWGTKAPLSGRMTIAWDFLVPVEKPFQGVQFIGNTWDSSAAVILLTDGEVILHADRGDASRVRIGEYKVGVWQSLEISLDIDARTLDVRLNGKKVAKGIPWLASSPKMIDRLSCLADYAPVDHGGAAVLYLDNIVVTSSSIQ